MKSNKVIPAFLIILFIGYASLIWEAAYEESKCTDICQGPNKAHSDFSLRVIIPFAGHQNVTCSCFEISKKVDLKDGQCY